MVGSLFPTGLGNRLFPKCLRTFAIEGNTIGNEGTKMQERHIDFLRAEYLKRRAKNPSYSMRAFAKQLSLSPARLCQVLNGKRPMTSKQVEKIVTCLKLSPGRQQFLLESVIRTGTKGKKFSPKYAQIHLDQFKFISDWYHSAILCLIKTNGFKSEPKTIAARLGLSVVEVQAALDRLAALGLIERCPGQIKAIQSNVAVGSGVASPALRKLHKQMLKKAGDSLEEVDVELRDITSITMAIDPKRLAGAKQLITTFRRKLCEYLEQGDQRSVYAFNMQLFPLSKIGGAQ